MAKDWTQLSVLVAGCGSIGKRHARILRELGVADVSACDPNASARDAFRTEVPDVEAVESYQAALEASPDAVVICTPPSLHVPMATEAILADCHVLCEKPLSETTDGVDDLSSLAAERRKKVMVALCFRYHAGVVRLREHLLSGRFGRSVSIRSMMGEYLPDIRPDYKTLHVAKENGAFDLIHDIDLAIWLAGSAVRSVSGVAATYSDIGIEAPDTVELVIDFEGRCTASVHLDFFQRPRRRRLELICTGGVVSLEFGRWDECAISTYDAAADRWEYEQIATDRDDMFRDEDREFLRAVAEDLPIACDIGEGRKSVEVVTAARRQYTSHDA